MNQEYIEILNEMLEFARKTILSHLTIRDWRSFESAVEEACEKQVARNPRGWNNECWNCGEHLTDDSNYCKRCGQKVEVSDERW